MSGHRWLTVYDICGGDADNDNPKPADEIIAEKKEGPSRVPIKLRDDEFKLPDSDLLKTLHYFISHKYTKKNRLFEESSLLTVGILIDYWMDEIVGDSSFNLYAEFANGNEKSSFKQAYKKKLENKIETRGRKKKKVESKENEENQTLLKGEHQDSSDSSPSSSSSSSSSSSDSD